MIKSIIKNNALFQISSIAVSVAVQILFVYLWGKYLPKDQIGIISIVSVATSFGVLFSNLGVTNYILYKQSLTKIQIQTLNNLMFFSSIFVAFLVFIVGIIVEIKTQLDFNSEFFYAALIFPFIGVGLTSQALLIRDKKLKEISIVEMSSKLISLILFLFLLNFERNANVYFYSQVIMWLTKSIGLNFFSRKVNTFDVRQWQLISLEGLLPFLKSLIGGQILNTISQKVDEVIFALVFSIEQLGVYYSFKQMATQLSAMYFNLVRRLFLPYLAESKSKIMYKKAYEFSTLVYTFFLMFVFFFSDILVSKLFNASLTNENLMLYFFSFSFFYLKYISGNIQTAFFQVLGLPMKELQWNFIQFFIVVVPISIIVSIFNVDFLYFVGVQLFVGAGVFITSYYFFNNKYYKIRSWLLIFPIIILSVLCFFKFNVSGIV